jgi:DNA-binding SARP family transcriptional activator
MGGVDYRILGSLEASRGGRPLALGGAKQRAVLALLLLGANRVVTTDELIEALWPSNPPGKPQTAIQGYVSQLRKTLEAERPFEVIVTEPAGYRLPVGPDELDLFRLESLLRQGRDALHHDRAELSSSIFRDALALFRGPPLADFTYESWAQPEIGRLEELRLTCLEERIEADLRLGRHAEIVGELEALVAELPLRERLRGHLLLALYRSGRQSEALAVYQEARRVLVEEFGIEPTRALQELEKKVLLQDPSLDLPRAARQERPTVGQLTLLFSDIEGSTRLVHRLGESYAQVLVEHRRLLRDALEGRNGRIVDNHGDCFFAAFERASDAAEAAAAAQRSLASYPWPGRLPVRVRIGIHTGEPVAVEDGLVGLDVHRASRICDAAHGGQILLSRETAGLLAGPGVLVDTKDLGEHVLKDLGQPEHLYQLVASGLPDAFPPPRSEQQSKAPAPDRSMLIVSGSDSDVRALVDVAEPLARSHVPHELIVARLVFVEGQAVSDVEDSIVSASSDLQELRTDLVARGVTTRVAAFTTASVGADVVRLASEQAVDLLLLARPREQLEGGVLDAELEVVFTNAPCDVAVCVAGEPRDEGDVVVPFGGSEHDWAALELAAWTASASGRRLRLLGVTGDPASGKRDASRLLAVASLAVQQLLGVPTEPTLLSAAGEGIRQASAGAALLVAGVPDDWRERGLGRARAQLAGAGPTTLFVRRGIRPGGLAPNDSLTRFTWSLSEVAS